MLNNQFVCSLGGWHLPVIYRRSGTLVGFAMQKLLIFSQQKYWHIPDINVRNYNETLNNDVDSFEQPGPDMTEILLKRM